MQKGELLREVLPRMAAFFCFRADFKFQVSSLRPNVWIRTGWVFHDQFVADDSMTSSSEQVEHRPSFLAEVHANGPCNLRFGLSRKIPAVKVTQSAIKASGPTV